VLENKLIYIETKNHIETVLALDNYKKQYSHYWNAILSGTGEITLEESGEDGIPE
jgi:hypothetical protein